MPDVYTNQPIATSKPTSSSHALSAFMVKPQGIKFETQAENEEIIIFLRQHLVVNIGWIFATVVLSIIPLFLLPLVQTSSITSSLPSGYLVVLPLLWYVGVFGYALVNFLHWYFNIYIVTNERVVDIDWVSLLYKHFASTKLDKVQDVSFKQAGVLDLFFDYGNVFVQTAGSEQNFEFESVPKPEMVVRQINQLVEKI